MEEETFEVRDAREKGWYYIDDKFLNGYARFLGIYAVGVYSSLCRHANKEQMAWPSISKIAEELGCGRNSILEGIKRLEFWHIISKKRIGKQTTNRYWLTKKRCWKPISEVCLKDFSEVCHTDFSSLLHKLQWFATQTSNSKETHNKETHNKEKVKTLYCDFIYLTQVEYNKLVERWGEKETKEKIKYLNNAIGSKGYKYKSHYYTLLNWDRKDKEQKQPQGGAKKWLKDTQLQNI